MATTSSSSPTCFSSRWRTSAAARPTTSPAPSPPPTPGPRCWPRTAKRGFDHYRHTLEELGRQPDTLALIFGKAKDTKSGAGQYFTPRALIQMAVGATTVLSGMRGRRVPAPDMMGA